MHWSLQGLSDPHFAFDPAESNRFFSFSPQAAEWRGAAYLGQVEVQGYPAESYLDLYELPASGEWMLRRHFTTDWPDRIDEHLLSDSFERIDARGALATLARNGLLGTYLRNGEKWLVPYLKIINESDLGMPAADRSGVVPTLACLQAREEPPPITMSKTMSTSSDPTRQLLSLAQSAADWLRECHLAAADPKGAISAHVDTLVQQSLLCRSAEGGASPQANQALLTLATATKKALTWAPAEHKNGKPWARGDALAEIRTNDDGYRNSVLDELNAAAASADATLATPTATDHSPVSDGPFIEGKFGWGGKALSLSMERWRLVSALWGKGALPVQTVGEAIYGNDEFEDGALRTLMSRLNDFFRKANLPFTVQRPRGMGRMELTQHRKTASGQIVTPSVTPIDAVV